MDEKKLQELRDAGVNTETALKRFMNNVSLMERLLKKFLDDKSYAALTAALDAGETEEAFKAAHTLKGVCGNLSFDNLFSIVSEQTEVLRAGNLEEGKAMMPQVTEAYGKVMGILKTL